MEARWLTVGPVQENTWIARPDGATKALLIDPGDEPETLKQALEELDATVEAILITHCHFDHVGAVAPMARMLGAPVYCPKLEVPVLADIMSWVPWPGFVSLGQLRLATAPRSRRSARWRSITAMRTSWRACARRPAVWTSSSTAWAARFRCALSAR